MSPIPEVALTLFGTGRQKRKEPRLDTEAPLVQNKDRDLQSHYSTDAMSRRQLRLRARDRETNLVRNLMRSQYWLAKEASDAHRRYFSEWQSPFDTSQRGRITVEEGVPVRRPLEGEDRCMEDRQVQGGLSTNSGPQSRPQGPLGSL